MRFAGVILALAALTTCSASSAAFHAPTDFSADLPVRTARSRPADENPGEEISLKENVGRTAFVAGIGIEAGVGFGDFEGFLPLVFVDAGIVAHGIGLRGVFKSIYWINQGGGEISVRLVNREPSYISVNGGGGMCSTEDDVYTYVSLGVEYGRACKKRLKGSFLCFQLGTDVALDSGEQASSLVYGSIALRHRWSSAPEGSTFGADRMSIRVGLGAPELAAVGLGIRLYDVWHLEARAGFIPVPDPPLSVVLEGYLMREKKGFQHGPCAAGAVVLNWDGQGYFAGGGYRIQLGRGDVRLGAEMLVYFRVAGKSWGLPIMPAPAVFLVWRPFGS